jgi:hypothetical protein
MWKGQIRTWTHVNRTHVNQKKNNLVDSQWKFALEKKKTHKKFDYKDMFIGISEILTISTHQSEKKQRNVKKKNDNTL